MTIHDLTIDDAEWILASAARDSLRVFVEQAWHIIEPGTPFVPNWHIDAICEHLEACSRHEIQNLLINIPPRCMKSILVSVMWPCWKWTHDPHWRWLFASYAQNLSTRDSVKCRNIIKSPWYQRNWGHMFVLTDDQNQKTRFENDKTGLRIATSVGGLATGEGGNAVVVDDAHSAEQASSQVEREGALQWWDETMSTRQNDPKKNCRVVVMQRLHERDLAGHILAKNSGYVHLMLPMEFEPDRKCVTYAPGFHAGMGPGFSAGRFEDPRTTEHELLWPERNDRPSVTSLKNELREYGTAGQLQQRPVPRGGGMFKRQWLDLVGAAPVKAKKIRYWDMAGTEFTGGNDPDWTAGVLMAHHEGIFYLCDIQRFRSSPNDTEKRIRQAAELDGFEVPIFIEQEPGSSGKNVVDYYIRRVLQGYTIHGDRPSGDKITRAEPWAAQAEAGNIKIVKGAWVEAYLAEIETFPAGAHDDQVDATSGAFHKLVGKKTAGAWGR